MSSNSKLTNEQKKQRKDWIAQLPEGFTMLSDGDSLTFLTVPAGSVTRVFSSVKSADETRFRRKVGEFHALQRFNDGFNEGLILPGRWSVTVSEDHYPNLLRLSPDEE